MTEIELLEAAVWWADEFDNDPSVTLLADRYPDWSIYEKRPCAREQESAGQVAVIGRRLNAPTVTPGWHIYFSQDGPFVTFFTWGGVPDDGFGGHRRTVTLTDGTEEQIVGGWHTGPAAARDAGFPELVEIGLRTSKIGDRLAGGTACFMLADRFASEVERLLPDVQIVDGVPRWRGRVSKAEWTAIERRRRDAIREGLKARYHDGSWHGGDWYRAASQAERDELKKKPYSTIGPVPPPPEPAKPSRTTDDFPF